MGPDVVIVGAGHNGLVAANYLADAGHAVTVLERRGVIGGATVTEELIPGFRSSSCAYVVGLLHPRIIRDLRLADHGLHLYQSDVANVNLLEDGRQMILWNDLGATLRGLEQGLPGESERFVALGLRLQRFAQLIEPWTMTAPPSLSGLRERFALAGEDRLFEEFFSLSVGELLDRYLEFDLLKGFLSFYALVSAWGGPWTPGWSFLYGHHSIGEFNGHMGQYGFPRGGMGAVADALAERARGRGVTIRTDAAVERILVEGGRVVGVLTEAGEEIPARAVASGADPHRTFLGLLEADDLPEEFRSEIERFDMRGSMARVHIALDGLPDFVGMEPGAGPHCRGLTLLGRGGRALRIRLAGTAPFGASRGLPGRVPDPERPRRLPRPDGQAHADDRDPAAPVRARGRHLGRPPGRVHRARPRCPHPLRAPDSRPHHRHAHDHPARSRARVRAHRRQHLPRRDDARPGVRPASGGRLGRLPDPDRGSLPVWVGSPSRRRGDGRPGAQRRAAS